jgi:DNA recombination protein RmuC
VHYPDSRDIIIDSKVSILAYTDYCNSDNDKDKADALSRHIQSIEKHIKELADKDYPSFANKRRETVDFTLMFIPNEASWQLAIMAKPELWDEAWKKKILITGPTNLMVFLKIIYITWNRNEQTKNQQRIMETAGQLLERLQSFYKSFDELGEQIEKTSKSYHDTLNRLVNNGRNHSVISSGERLLSLGAKPKKVMQLPSRFHLHCEELIFDEVSKNSNSLQEDNNTTCDLLALGNYPLESTEQENN